MFHPPRMSCTAAPSSACHRTVFPAFTPGGGVGIYGEGDSGDGGTELARVVLYDPELDIAVLSVDTGDAPILQFDESVDADRLRGYNLHRIMSGAANRFGRRRNRRASSNTALTTTGSQTRAFQL